MTVDDVRQSLHSNITEAQSAQTSLNFDRRRYKARLARAAVRGYVDRGDLRAGLAGRSSLRLAGRCTQGG